MGQAWVLEGRHRWTTWSGCPTDVMQTTSLFVVLERVKVVGEISDDNIVTCHVDFQYQDVFEWKPPLHDALLYEFHTLNHVCDHFVLDRDEDTYILFRARIMTHSKTEDLYRCVHVIEGRSFRELEVPMSAWVVDHAWQYPQESTPSTPEMGSEWSSALSCTLNQDKEWKTFPPEAVVREALDWIDDI